MTRTVKQAPVVLAMMAAIAVVGCAQIGALGQPKPTATPKPTDGYLYVTTEALGYVRFLVNAGGHVSGLWNADLVNSDGSATYGTGTFTGTISSAGQVVLRAYSETDVAPV